LLYWSPATGNLALAGDQDVRIMPLPRPGIQPQTLGAAAVQLLPAETPTILAGAQSAPRLAWADANNQIFSLDASAGGPAASVVQEDAPVTGLALAPDGNSLAVATSDGNLAIVFQLAQQGGQAPQEFALPAWLTHLSYSPDGRSIGGTDLPNFLVYILDAQNGRVVHTLEWFDSPSANLYGAFFAPDWSRIAWVAQTAVQIMNVADGSKGPLLNHEDHISAVAWSPDGARLATVSVTHTDAGPAPAVLIWDPAAGTLVTVLPQPSAVRSLAFSPNGDQIAVVDSQQNLQVWNLER
jgi:WD40 repeat protein